MAQLGKPLIIFIVAISSINSDPIDENSPIVETSQGPVQGIKFISSWTKKPVYAFRGIPYAAPPIGDLRFKDPVLPENWTSVRNCSSDKASCMQASNIIIGVQNLTFEMSEDCLYLNVYIPQIPKEGAELLPVMVWVHGGGFFEGSGSYNRYGPDFLVGEDIIVVTLNYRLGALGFLTLGTTEFPGNAGMKDQNFALHWVQREIQQFGGDPGKVTLFGESAGSASVHLHYLSPLSKGLFSRVIGESGTALVDWAVRDSAEMYGVQLAELLNCRTVDMKTIGKCLKDANAEDIVAAQVKVTPLPEDPKKSALIFVPVVDSNTSSQPFLPYYPAELVDQKQGSFVPFIMGINSDEGMMMIRSEESIINITNNLVELLPADVQKKSSDSRLKLLVERMKQFYFKENPSPSNLRGYVDLFTDQMFGYSTAVSARQFRKRAPVYLYYFAFNGKFKEIYSIIVQNKFNFTGVSHAEEMSYLFERQKVNQKASDDSNEMKTWRRMIKLWTNFAKFGKPTIRRDPELEDLEWKPVSSVTLNYLHIDENLTMIENDFIGPRVMLWDSLTPSRSSYLHATGLLVALLVTIYLCYSAKFYD